MFQRINSNNFHHHSIHAIDNEVEYSGYSTTTTNQNISHEERIKNIVSILSESTGRNSFLHLQHPKVISPATLRDEEDSHIVGEMNEETSVVSANHTHPILMSNDHSGGDYSHSWMWWNTTTSTQPSPRQSFLSYSLHSIRQSLVMVFLVGSFHRVSRILSSVLPAPKSIRKNSVVSVSPTSSIYQHEESEEDIEQSPVKLPIVAAVKDKLVTNEPSRIPVRQSVDDSQQYRLINLFTVLVLLWIEARFLCLPLMRVLSHGLWENGTWLATLIMSHLCVTLLTVFILYTTQFPSCRKTLLQMFKRVPTKTALLRTQYDTIAFVSIVSCICVELLLTTIMERYHIGTTAVYHVESILYTLITPCLLQILCRYASLSTVYSGWCLVIICSCVSLILLVTVQVPAPVIVGSILISLIILAHNQIQHNIIHNYREDVKMLQERIESLSEELQVKKQEIVSQRYILANTAHDMKTVSLHYLYTYYTPNHD